MKIIYQDDEGLAIIGPADNAGLTVEEIAKKDVPTGLPYKIVEDDYIPTDRTFRMSWEIDESLLTDGVGE